MCKDTEARVSMQLKNHKRCGVLHHESKHWCTERVAGQISGGYTVKGLPE